MISEPSMPWVEKYRPNIFDDVVLDDINYQILKNVIDTNTFPNMLLYGPPGTGKTTTVINLIHSYQKKYDQSNKGLMIHLNASDERGIDIVRNQISQFVNSQSLFAKGLKIVVLDEVDYMTKNAQQALKQLLQGANNNVRFCLICNYISRIDESLQNELLHLRFNCLPVDKITNFLMNINKLEKVNASVDVIESIQKLFKSDIRSMINYMQSNQYNIDTKKIIDISVWISLHDSLLKGKKYAVKKFSDIENNYNIDTRNIIKGYINYTIASKSHNSSVFLDFCEVMMHLQETNVIYMRNYFIEHIGKYILV
jgi:DNA polymerase III delta prime subunit